MQLSLVRQRSPKTKTRQRGSRGFSLIVRVIPSSLFVSAYFRDRGVRRGKRVVEPSWGGVPAELLSSSCAQSHHLWFRTGVVFGPPSAFALQPGQGCRPRHAPHGGV